MTYFCAKCQKRHKATEISADMWSICHEEVIEGLDQLSDDFQQTMPDEVANELADFFSDMISFLQGTETVMVKTAAYEGPARLNSFFRLNSHTLKQLKDTGRKELTISGTYSIRLDLLISLFMKYSPDAERHIDNKSQSILEEWRTVPICEKPLIAYFDENRVLDKVTDRNNVAFAVDGKMLGFVRICPHCGCVLSRASGKADEIVVALAGSPRAGKTSCLVAMVNSLMYGTFPGIRIDPMPHDEKWAQLAAEVENYRKCMKTTKTPDTQTEVPAYSMLVRLKDAANTKRVLTIVDMPGEFWQSGEGLTADFFEQYSGTYENIDCIWFVTSKATVRLSQNDIPDIEKERLLEETAEDAEVIRKSNPMNLQVNFGMLRDQLASRTGKTMPPTIVIVSKPDYMASDNDREATIHYELFPDMDEDVSSCNAQEMHHMLKIDNERLHGLNERAMYRHGHDVRSFIKDFNPLLLSAIEDNCGARFYVSVSPYGGPAESDQDTPTPYHELFPLVWTLAITGALRIYHKCIWKKKNFLRAVVSTSETIEPVVFDYRANVRPEGGQQAKDRVQVLGDVRSNLLMQNKMFIVSEFDHERK